MLERNVVGRAHHATSFCQKSVVKWLLTLQLASEPQPRKIFFIFFKGPSVLCEMLISGLAFAFSRCPCLTFVFIWTTILKSIISDRWWICFLIRHIQYVRCLWLDAASQHICLRGLADDMTALKSFVNTLFYPEGSNDIKLVHIPSYCCITNVLQGPSVYVILDFPPFWIFPQWQGTEESALKGRTHHHQRCSGSVSSVNITGRSFPINSIHASRLWKCSHSSY